MSSSEDEIMEEDVAVSVGDPIGSAEESNDDGDDEGVVAAVDMASDQEEREEGDGDEPEVADEDITVNETVEDEEELEEGTAKSEVAEEDDDDVEEAPETPKSTSGSSPKRSRKKGFGGSRKGRAPAVKGLTIPFRAVKRTMKLDKDIATVQNEAAIVATFAAELFLKSLAKDSHSTAKSHGRNTIRYEDVAEARTKKPAFSFLDALLP